MCSFRLNFCWSNFAKKSICFILKQWRLFHWPKINYKISSSGFIRMALFRLEFEVTLSEANTVKHFCRSVGLVVLLLAFVYNKKYRVIYSYSLQCQDLNSLYHESPQWPLDQGSCAIREHVETCSGKDHCTAVLHIDSIGFDKTNKCVVIFLWRNYSIQTSQNEPSCTASFSGQILSF